jgi:hypothetical protein
VVRHPGRAIGIDDDPIAISIQIAGAGVHIVRQILAAFIGQQIGIAPVVPLIPLVALFITRYQMGALITRCHMDKFPRVESKGEVLILCIQHAFPHDGIRDAVFQYIESVHTGLVGIECSGRRIDLESYVAADRQGSQSHQDPDLDQVLTGSQKLYIRPFGQA